MRSKVLYMVLVALLVNNNLTCIAQHESPGIVKIDDFNFNQGYATLAGQWEFYHDQLLTPAQLDTVNPTEFIRVPGSWHWQKDYATLGKATYKCKVVLPPGQRGLLMYISMITASSKVWVNGVIRSTSGILAQGQNGYKAELTNNFVPLPENKDTLEIVIQTANYSYFSSGLVSTPIIGNTSAIIKEKALRNGIENLFAGSLIAMFIYQSLLYFLYKRGKPNLWLALICLVVAIRSMTLNGGSFLLPNLFPEVPFEIWKKMEFGGVYLSAALFPLYIHHLFQTSSSKWIIRIFLSISAFLVGAVIFTPQHVYGQLLDVCHVTLVLTFIYAIVTILRAWFNEKSRESKYIFFGVIASFPFILMEILKNTALVNFDIRFGYLVELGLLVFLIFQVYILARHYANSYKSLEVINKELEAEVADRTHDLVSSNKIKDRLLSIISHDVKSPLNNLRGLISLHEATNLNQTEFNQFVKQIDDNLSKTNSMVENILFWTARQRKGENIRMEMFDLKALVDDNINQMLSVALSKSLNLSHDLDHKLMIESDHGIANFVVRNLLANAIKFSHENGSIEVHLRQTPKEIKLAVTDHGIGMSKDQLEKLFEHKQAESVEGTAAEQGTGLGLNLAKEYLEQIGGKLVITSTLEMGSTFEMVLPK